MDDGTIRMLPARHVTQQPSEPRIDVIIIKCARFYEDLLATVQIILAPHKARMDIYDDYCLMTFPSGTYKLRYLPVMGSERYEIHFPDGWIIVETEAIVGDISLIDIPTGDYPAWAIKKYSKM